MFSTWIALQNFHGSLSQGQVIVSVAETGFLPRSVLLKIKSYTDLLYFAVTPGVRHLGPTIANTSPALAVTFPALGLSGSLFFVTATVLTALQMDTFNVYLFE